MPIEDVIKYMHSSSQLNHVGLKKTLEPILLFYSYSKDVRKLYDGMDQNSNTFGTIQTLELISKKYSSWHHKLQDWFVEQFDKMAICKVYGKFSISYFERYNLKY